MTVSPVRVYLAVGCMFGNAVASYCLMAAFDLAVGLRLGIAAGVVGFAVLAARWSPRGTDVVAATSAPLVLWSFAAASRELDAVVVGLGQWCGTGQLASAMMIAAMILPLSLGTALFVMRYGLPQRGLASPWLTGVLAVVFLAAVGVAAERIAARPTLAQFKQGFGPKVRAEYGIDPLTRPSRELLRSGSLVLSLDCSNSERPCRTALDLGDGLGVRKLRYDELVHGEAMVVEPHTSGKLWRLTLEGQRGVREHYPPVGVVLGRAGSPSELSVGDLPGMIAPPWQVVALALPGLLGLLVATGWIARERRRLVHLATGREAQLDAQGFVELDGERLRVESSELVAPAPVIVLPETKRSGAFGYRSAPLLGGRAVVFGHLEAHQRRFDEAVRSWRPLLVIVALQLGMPLLAALRLG